MSFMYNTVYNHLLFHYSTKGQIPHSSPLATQYNIPNNFTLANSTYNLSFYWQLQQTPHKVFPTIHVSAIATVRCNIAHYTVDNAQQTKTHCLHETSTSLQPKKHTRNNNKNMNIHRMIIVCSTSAVISSNVNTNSSSQINIQVAITLPDASLNATVLPCHHSQRSTILSSL